MSNSSNRQIQKAIQKKPGIDPTRKALKTAMKNFKNASAKSRDTNRPGSNDPS